MAVDPVCKMEVDEETAEHVTEHEGNKYYFCSAGCKTSFEEDPSKYLGGEPEEATEEPAEPAEEPAEAPVEEFSEAEVQEAAPPTSDKKPWWKFW